MTFMAAFPNCLFSLPVNYVKSQKTGNPPKNVKTTTVKKLLPVNSGNC